MRKELNLEEVTGAASQASGKSIVVATWGIRS